MADLVYVFLTLMLFCGCAVIAGFIDRSSGLRAEVRPSTVPGEMDAGAQL